MPAGAKPGEYRGGRKKGTPNKHTAIRHGIIDRALAEKATPLEVMLKVMGGDLTITPLQLQAAIMAAPYIHPKLSATIVKAEVTGRDGGPIQQLNLVSSDPIEAAQIYQKLLKGGDDG